MAMDLQIQSEEINKKYVLRLTGRIDAFSATSLEKKLKPLLEDQNKHVLLDFTNVDYLSSAGMRVLLFADKKLKQQKGSLILFALDDEVKGILKVAGFDTTLNICETEQQALNK
jgi:anti-sigma B factor antagonist/stage II sporulation protein AA (anti-sigma F factor antagonist)